MAVDIFMPKMSDHMEEGEIIRWRVREGDRVEQGQIILELMTDKVVAELEAPAAGIVKGIRAGDGDKVPVGETFAFIVQPDESVPALRSSGLAAPEKEEKYEPAMPAALAEASQSVLGEIRAVPAARRLAKELGIDLAKIAGSGPNGTIREQDVRAFAEATKLSPFADIGVRDARIGSGESWLDLNPIQRLSGQRMLESMQTAPQFATEVDVDMTKTLEVRGTLTERIQQTTGARLSITAILVKVVALTLRDYPSVNCSFDNGRIKLHPQVNLGVAVGTESGVLVPVIKEADCKKLAQIARELKTFQERAKSLRFNQDELSGGTFTISNLGMYGIDRFKAIVNPPESAILAVGQIVNKPVALLDGTIAVRPIMTLTLSVDHRAMDGVQAAKFLTAIKAQLENPSLDALNSSLSMVQ